MRILVFAIGVFFTTFLSSLFANGGSDKTVELEGMSNELADVVFLTRIDPEIFLLTAVSDKYRVLCITIENNTSADLDLSVDKDSVVAETDSGHQQSGVLDIYRREPAFWDSLSQQLRKKVEYPKTVPSNEQEIIFVFFDKSSMDAVPIKLSYTIGSVNKTVTIGQGGGTGPGKTTAE
jgi:hypothetical protein